MNNDNMFWNGGSWVTKEKEERPHRAKIIDAHYHIFPKLGSQKEGIDPALRTRFWQYHSREFNNWWRVDTGEKVDQQFLEFKSNNMADMPNVNFRLIDYGKARITIDKIDYDMQFYTPNLINNELPPERGIGEMNLAGVDIGILQADHVYGDLANFYGKAMRDYPDRFIGLAQIWEPEANNEVRLAKLERSIVEQCNKGLYFSVEPLAVMEKDVSLTDPMFDSLWELTRKLKVPVFWFLDDRTINRSDMYMRRISELAQWVKKHPDINCVITHGLVPAAIIHEIGIPDEVVEVLCNPSVFAEILFPAKFPDYPYPEGQEMLKQLRDQVGANKLMWGSDSPFGLTMWCTYKQSIDFIRIHCDFLTTNEKEQILGVNSANLFGIDPYHPN